jgi:hypothetical protein
LSGCPPVTDDELELLDGAWEFVRLLVAAGVEPDETLIDLVASWELDRVPYWYRLS